MSDAAFFGLVGIGLFFCGMLVGGVVGAVITLRYVYVKGTKWANERETEQENTAKGETGGYN
jgi:hypothetical protein